MEASAWRHAAAASKGSVVPLKMRQVSTFAVMRSAGVEGGELAIPVTCRRNSGLTGSWARARIASWRTERDYFGRLLRKALSRITTLSVSLRSFLTRIGSLIADSCASLSSHSRSRHRTTSR